MIQKAIDCRAFVAVAFDLMARLLEMHPDRDEIADALRQGTGCS